MKKTIWKEPEWERCITTKNEIQKIFKQYSVYSSTNKSKTSYNFKVYVHFKSTFIK